MKAMHKAVQRALNILGAVVLALALVLFGYALAGRLSGNPMPQVFGWGYSVVISDSMGQAMPKNSLIIVKEQESYRSGDIVTYLDGHGSLVTHRLVSIENNTAVTKGDVNNAEDKPFSAGMIYGKVQAILPGLGGALLWLQSPMGMIAVMIIFLLLWFQPWRYLGRKADSENGNEA